MKKQLHKKKIWTSKDFNGLQSTSILYLEYVAHLSRADAHINGAEATDAILYEPMRRAIKNLRIAASMELEAFCNLWQW